MSLNVLVLGGSRNIGYYSALRLLDAGSRVTFLLRSPSVFDSDEAIKKHVQDGKAFLVKGDALVREDVQAAWDKAVEQGHVDVLLFTVGGTAKLSLTKGAVINPANLVTQSLLNTLSTMPSPSPNREEQTRIVVISSRGITKLSHAKLPLPLKMLYGWLLRSPHADKLGAERLLAHVCGWDWDLQNDGEPGADIMGTESWRQIPGLPGEGTLGRVLVIRPVLLTDGVCKADSPKTPGWEAYKVSEDELKGWTVSRRDVAHFVVDALLNRWNEFEGKVANIAY